MDYRGFRRLEIKSLPTIIYVYDYNKVAKIDCIVGDLGHFGIILF